MLYLVTNRKLAEGDFYQIIEEAGESGLDAVILREKDLDFKDYYPIGSRTKDILDRLGIPLIINGSIDLARELKCHGYHSGFAEFKEKGKLYSYQGVSVHSLEEALEAERLGADYLLVGHIFESQCKPGLRPRGLDFIEEIKKQLKIPLVAIGGIDPSNIGDLKDLGITRVAVMSYIMASEDVRSATKKLDQALKDH